VETDCLQPIGMIVNCTTPDLAMLCWVAFVRSFNPDIRHIKGKDNSVADMLSRASLKDQDHKSDDNDKETEMNYTLEERSTGYDAVIENAEQVQVDTGAGEHIGNKTVSRTDGQEEIPILEFITDLYSEDLLAVGRYLSSLTKDPAWSNEEFSGIKQKSTKYFVKEGFLWRRRQKRDARYLTRRTRYCPGCPSRSHRCPDSLREEPDHGPWW
jgi:hypothetical protein